MMLQADRIEFHTTSTPEQDGPLCTAYAHLGAIKLIVKNKFKREIEFDYIQLFKEMKVYRERNRLRDGRRKRYVTCFLEIGKTKGFKTTDGQIVKVGRHRECHKDHDMNCRQLQYRGPLPLIVDYYNKHSFRGDPVEPLSDRATKRKTSHMVFIKAGDRTAKEYVIQDSIGKPNRRLPFDVFDQLMNRCYSMWDITITK